MEQKPIPENGRKTILVVDDDPSNLGSLSAWLVEGDYNVLRAGSAAEAYRQSADYANEIHLLMSNFQVAGMSGVELAARMISERPQLKALLMSGFTEGMLVLNEGWHFLSKPHVHSHLRTLIAGLIDHDGGIRFSETPGAKLQPPRSGARAALSANSRPARRRMPTGGKSPRPPASDYHRQSPRAAGRPSRGPRESSR
jgi:DNA-binding NtrC family response regulator